MAQKRKKRAAVSRQAKAVAPLLEMGRVEKRFETAAVREVVVARHALDRMHFWGGISLLILAVVLSVNGVADITYLSTGVAGVLAVLIE